MMGRHVVVIGAGVVGAASAVQLLEAGHRVTILEPGVPGGEQAASFGNAAWFSTASILPVSMPGIWKKVPRFLSDPLGPLTIRWSYLPRLLPWLRRFLAASSLPHVQAAARALRPLIADSPVRHLALATAAGVPGLVERKGVLYVYRDRAAFLADALAWRLRRESGVVWIELEDDQLRQHEPSLGRQYGFGVLVPDGGNCRDPGGYVKALVAYAQARGAARLAREATGFRLENGRLAAVATDAGEIACDAAVIAAGAYAARLARLAGDAVPLETERGYHVTIPSPAAAPRHPIALQDAGLAMTMLAQGLRVAGQVELAGLAAPPNWQRAERVKRLALAAFPGLADALDEPRITRWMGHRPSTPDGLPCIGPSRRSTDIIHAFGHGHIGLSASAMTGQLVTDLISSKPPSIDIAAFSPQRFPPA
jgi:D-amino-acid dehydrogenase